MLEQEGKRFLVLLLERNHDIDINYRVQHGGRVRRRMSRARQLTASVVGME